MKTLLQNALYFPAHDFYLPSTYHHDYVTFEYLPGHDASTDGGLSYLHRTVPPPEHRHLVVPFDLYTEDSYQTILDKLLWGSLPLDKAKPQVHVYRPISTLANDHLGAILKNCLGANALHLAVVKHWFYHRRDNPIPV